MLLPSNRNASRLVKGTIIVKASYQHDSMITSSFTSTSLPCNCTVLLRKCSAASGNDVLLVGCYNHKDGAYSGGFEVLSVQQDKHVICSASWTEPFGVFDMVAVDRDSTPRWLMDKLPSLDADLVLCACTDGVARMLVLDASNVSAIVHSEILAIALHREMITCAMCCIVARVTDRETLLIAATTHKGALCVAEIGDSTGTAIRLSVVEDAHEFDAWCVALHPRADGQAGYPLLWTGGDDGKVKLWSSLDVLCGGKDTSPIYSQLRAFDAGVVTIVPVPLFAKDEAGPQTMVGCTLLVGSYDENLRCLDVSPVGDLSYPLLTQLRDAVGDAAATARMQLKAAVASSMKQPLVEEPVGGGAWRIRLGEGSIAGCGVLLDALGYAGFRLAVAAMQGGAVVLTMEVSKGISVAGGVVGESQVHFHASRLGGGEHAEPLVYDVAFVSNGAVASLSFYDRHVAISTPSLTES